MKKALLYILSAMLITACGGGKDKEKKSKTDLTEDFTTDSVQNFVPEAGMLLQEIVDIPGIEWRLDTIKGVCITDTLVLWAKYGDRYLPTNIRGSIDKLKYITENGRQAFESGDTLLLRKTDFTEGARLKYDLDISRGAMMHDADSIYRKRLREMTDIARDFFSSYGMTRYMAAPLAKTWQRRYDAAEEDDSEVQNPFNGSYYVEFDTQDISVDVVDAEKGYVIVRTFCIDENTLGRQGWAQWEMQMCREGKYFRVKTLPKLHR